MKNRLHDKKAGIFILVAIFIISVVDADYRGEWFACISNHNNVPIVIVKESVELPLLYENAIVYPYKKAICQALLIPVPRFTEYEITYNDLKNNFVTERGDGCLGSSKK